MFLAGMLILAVEMFLCAQAAEPSTKECIYEPSKEIKAANSQDAIKNRSTVI